MIDRRTFVGSAAACAVMVSARANAQRGGALPRVALVFNNIPLAEMAGADPAHRLARAFVHGLRDLGLVEGRNIIIERRSAEGRYDRLPGLIQDLLALQVDVVVAIGPALWAAKRATDATPIVAVGDDGLVDEGVAAGLARPGRNLTGLTTEVGIEGMNGKRLQLLKEVVPKTLRVAFLGVSNRPLDRYRRSATEAAADALGLTLTWVVADTPDEFEAAFAAIGKDRADALLVDGTTVNYVHTRRIGEFAARLRLPAVYNWREGPEAGGLMSYGSNAADLYRRSATYVDKILKGAKPGELPIKRPTKFELVINLKTARALGITIPQSLLLRADEVIDDQAALQDRGANTC